MSYFIVYWLHIPRTSVVQVITLIKVSERSTKEDLCKISCFCWNVLPSATILSSNFWLQAHTIRPPTTGIVLLLNFMEPKGFSLISQQPATYSSPEPGESSQCPSIPLKTTPVLSFHLCLYLQSDFFSSGFSVKTQQALFFSPTQVTGLIHLIFIDLNFQIIFKLENTPFWQPIPGYLSIWSPNYSCEFQQSGKN